MQKRHLLLYLIMFSIFIATECIDSEKSSVPDALNKGNLAPNFSLFDKEGNTVTLEQFAGKKVYLNLS